MYEGEASDDDLSADEEDPELMSLTEDACGVRELAIQDWVRNRILDGHWISPADEWFNCYHNGRPRLAPAQHPCPWHRSAIYEGALDDGQEGEALQHPRPKTLCPFPPPFGLCEQALRIADHVRDKHMQAAVRDSLGYIHHRLGRPARAAEQYRLAIAGFRELGSAYYEAMSLNSLGDVQRAEQQPGAAAESWQRARTILEYLRHPRAGEVAAKLG